MSKIAVLIPTYNRSNFIEELWNSCISEYSGNLFSFFFADSSSDNKTETFVCSKKSQVSSKITYKRFDSIQKVDEKIINAINEIDSEFLFLSHDTQLIDFNKLESFLITNHYENLSILNINGTHSQFVKYNLDKKIDTIYTTDDLKGFCKKTFTYLTLYGASIVKTKLLKYDKAMSVWSNYKDSKYGCYLYVTALFTGSYFLHDNSDKYGILFSSLPHESLQEKKGWVYGESFVETFFAEFEKDVNLLPPFFDSCKQEIVFSFRKECGELTLKALIKKKAFNGLTYGLIKKYKKQIKNPPYHYGRIIFVTLFLPKFICKSIYKFYKILKINQK